MKTRKFHHLMVMLALVALTGFLPSVSSAGGEYYGTFPRVMMSGPAGETYGELSARWWEWLVSIPAEKNPNLDETGANCAQGQYGNVWFLGSSFGGSATRTCTIPKGKPIFLTIINAAGYDPQPQLGETTILYRQIIGEWMDGAANLKCTLDGRPCAYNLFALRAQSPVFTAIQPKDGVYSEYTDAKILGPMVADGYWVLLSPLRPGHHVLKFGGELPDLGFSVDVTYNLTVPH